MSATAFQRRRRMIAAQLAEQEANTPLEETSATNDKSEAQTKPLSPDDVDGMDIEKVKEFLEQFEVKFAHNTGEAKLREKLKDAIG